jgi:uncharacterized protein YndB with AHSA1/START domain
MDDVEKTILINAPVEQVWVALTDPSSLNAWMGADGVQHFGARPGDSFAVFGGETTGKITQVVAPNLLEYTWRQASWQSEWQDSLVRWDLLASGRATLLHLVHSGFPTEEERDGHDEGWDLYWLAPMQTWLEGER